MGDTKNQIKDSDFIDVNYKSIEYLAKKIFKSAKNLSFDEAFDDKLLITISSKDKDDSEIKLIVSIEEIDADLLSRITVEAFFPYKKEKNIFEYVNEQNNKKPSKSVAIVNKDIENVIKKTSSSIFTQPIKENNFGWIFAQCTQEIFE